MPSASTKSSAILRAPGISVRPDFVELCRSIGPMRVVFDCGSRDARDGLRLAEEIGASEVHVFECHPRSAEQCRATAREAGDSIRVVVNEVAIAAQSGRRTFYINDPERTVTVWADGNPGASSLFRADPGYTAEKYVQIPIEVEAITIDEYCKRTGVYPDVIWMDLQGAEVEAFSGGRETTARARVIHVEVAFRPVYDGQPLFSQVRKALNGAFSLERLYTGRWPRLPRLYERLRAGPWFGDAVFVRR